MPSREANQSARVASYEPRAGTGPLVPLDPFPRVRLIHLPTPLEEAPSLSRDLGLSLFVKRDDVMTLALGGNKARKLEYLIGDAKAKGADTVITTGAKHSNHARLTAAACVKTGLKPILVLRGKPEEAKGNLLLDNLLGAEVRFTEDVPEDAMIKIAEELEGEGRKAYVIPAGGASPVGTLGYVNAAQEILTQARQMGIQIDYVIHATGTGPTQAGLVLGFRALNADTEVIGISNGPQIGTCKERVRGLITGTSQLLQLNLSVHEDAIIVYDDYTCGGYGVITGEVVEAMKYAARTDGLILDPVYTGKAFMGVMHLAEKKVIEPNSKVVFLHTGGSPITFQYDREVSRYL